MSGLRGRGNGRQVSPTARRPGIQRLGIRETNLGDAETMLPARQAGDMPADDPNEADDHVGANAQALAKTLQLALVACTADANSSGDVLDSLEGEGRNCTLG